MKNNTYYTEQEVKYYSQIGLSAQAMYIEWLEEYYQDKIKEITIKYGDLCAKMK